MFSVFPRGTPGVGLLLLRTTIGLVTAWQGATLIAAADSAWLQSGAGLTALVAAAALIVGLLTPCAAALVAVGAAMSLSPGSPRDGLAQGLVLIDAMSLVLLGPGAFSVDARLFGLREIRIEPSRAPRE